MDCADGSDEVPSACLNHTCLDSMLKCRDGMQCVPKKQFCDKKSRGSSQYQCRLEVYIANVFFPLFFQEPAKSGLNFGSRWLDPSSCAGTGVTNRSGAAPKSGKCAPRPSRRRTTRTYGRAIQQTTLHSALLPKRCKLKKKCLLVGKA